MSRDREKQRKYQRQWMARRRAEWIEANGPCAQCGSTQDLQVDHRDPEEKELDPAGLWSLTKERREVELAKCQVLCRTCHKEKTRQELIRRIGSEGPLRTVLTEPRVRAIRARYDAGGVTLKVIAAEEGLPWTTVRDAAMRRSWQHVK